jgi:glycosyltransferase involved in cell wall biosynthesis
VTSVCYIDAAIRNNTGHHANACRRFVNEFARRGFVVDAYGNRSLDPKVGRELRAEPLFRHYPYSRLRRNAYFSYLAERTSFLFDLESAWRRGPYDLVFFYCAMSAQLCAIALWLRRFSLAEMPFVVIGFDVPSGSKLNDYWSYQRPFYRKFTKLFRVKYLARMLLFTFDQAITGDYAELLDLPVQTMPSVHAGLHQPRLRKRDRNGLINVALLGHQRREKGYHLVPDIARRLIDRRSPVKLLLHNSAPDDSPISQELRDLASSNANVTFIEESGDQTHWQDLLDRSDLVVLPYEPNRYRESGSGVANEAVSDGIPMVVPSGTTMETLAVGYQGCAISFSSWGAEEVTDAIERAVTNFEVLARQAEAGASVWRRNNGVGLFVDRLLEIMTYTHRFSDAKCPKQPSGKGLVDKLLARIHRMTL